MLKKLILVGSLALAASATPAMAQRYGYDGGGYAARIQATGDRILNAHANGRLAPGEYRVLSREQRELERVYDRYRQGGLTRWERAHLDRKIAALNDARRYGVRDNRWARNDRGYGDRYDNRRGDWRR